MAGAGALQTRKEGTDRPVRGRPDPREATDLYERLLVGVSRTFALTIPQLPDGLREAVTNAYLLCRIADTIEDDPLLDTETKDSFHTAFIDAAESGRGAEDFAEAVWPRLAPGTLDAEIELIRESPLVLQITHRLEPSQRSAILRCLGTMSRGMGQFERSRSLRGLMDVAELERYCYFVAEAANLSVENVNAMVLGGHGDTMVPVRSSCLIAGIPVSKFLDDETLKGIETRTRKAGGEVVGLLGFGSAFASPAWSALEMAEAIIYDKRKIMPVCA